MSLLNRVPRPFTRGPSAFRDDRLFIIACDDTYAPKQYFDFFRLRRVQIHVVPTLDGSSSAEHVLDRLLAVECEPDDERWMVLDADHYTHGRHLRSLTLAISRAQQSNVKVAMSKPCFEVWLLLHHRDETVVPGLPDAGAVCAEIRNCRGNYNKTSLREEHYPLQSVADAFARAHRLDHTVPDSVIPQDNTTRIYKILASIAQRASAVEFPNELRAILKEPLNPTAPR